MDFFSIGLRVPQELFANVARTSSDVGTLSVDMVRAMRFSRLSFPASENASVSWQGSGFPGYDIGFSAATLALDTPWYDILRKTIMLGTPVMVLQHFLPTDAGGHWRVVYGFNSTHLFMKDPWNREDQPLPDYIITYDEFTALWQYEEINGASEGKKIASDKKVSRIRTTPFSQKKFSPSEKKFLGVAAVPWRLSVLSASPSPAHGSSTQLSVSFSYDAAIPSAFIQDTPNAQKIELEISYDPTVWATSRSPILLPSPLSLGDSQTASFNLTCIATTQTCSTSSVSIRASGLISSSSPPAVNYGRINFPSYDYMDMIGSAWTKFTFGA